MVEEYCPRAHVPRRRLRIGTPSDDGRGIRMGASAGAAVRGSMHSSAHSRSDHRTAWPGASLSTGTAAIHQRGHLHGSHPDHALSDRDGFVYMITDDVIYEPNVIGLRICHAAATPEELASDLELAPEALARTVRQYRGRRPGGGPRFPQTRALLQPIGVPPASGIGAIDLRVDHGAIYATFTLGGLVTDPDGARARRGRPAHPRSLRGGPDGGQPRRPPLRQRHQPR